MEKNNLTFKEYQLEILDLYEKIYTIFDDLKMKWWLHSGSLLGIIRHDRKMVPWDDDIDMMIIFNEWKIFRNELIQRFNQLDLLVFEFGYNNHGPLNSFPFLKICKKKIYKVYSYSGNTIDDRSVFVDIFFSVPSIIYTDKQWKRYSKIVNLKWAVEKGFNRWQFNETNKLKLFFINLSTYPLKFILPKKYINKKINSPYESNLISNVYRRADKWSYRSININIKDDLIETTLSNKKANINKNFKAELKESYGSNWNSEIVYSGHYEGKIKKLKREIFIMEIISKYNSQEIK